MLSPIASQGNLKRLSSHFHDVNAGGEIAYRIVATAIHHFA